MICLLEGEMMNVTPETETLTLSPDTCWEAVQNRDARLDGRFYYGVSTTGVYCRPACPSRLPRRAHVHFFASPQAAEQAGFRPCKRCQPQLPQSFSPALELIQRACRTLEEAERSPSLTQLAEAAGMSPYHFQRLFKKHVGISPKQYFLQKRGERLRGALAAGTTVTEAIYAAGYGSSAPLYTQAAAELGMRPAQYQHGGPGQQIQYAVAASFLGWVLVARTAAGICAIDFGADPGALEAALRARFPQAEQVSADAEFEGWVRQVLTFLEEPAGGLHLPLDIRGTAFQRRVWAALQDIPAGQTATYGQVAQRMGSPKAVRAVAQACGANTLAVAIPCHRVVAAGGQLGGYRWGVERKRQLLEREARPSE